MEQMITSPNHDGWKLQNDLFRLLFGEVYQGNMNLATSAKVEND